MAVALSEGAKLPIFRQGPCRCERRLPLNSYTVLYSHGDSTEVDAEFYEADGVDLVFYAEGTEALRVSAANIVSVTKVPTRHQDQEDVSSHLFL